MTLRPSTAAPIVAALGILALPLVIYVAGYFWLSEYSDLSRYGTYRVFANEPLRNLYAPATFVESQWRGTEIITMSHDGWIERLMTIASAPPLIDPESEQD